MSVTTTDNSVTRQVLQVLADYDVHHSGDPESSGVFEGPNERQNEPEVSSGSNPDWWLDSYRGVPPHRPINRHLDMEERPGGANTFEVVFIFAMLNGVGLNSALARLWHKTGGRFNDKLFYYKIGGEK